MLDGPVGERADNGAGIENGLADAEAAVEVALGERSVALIRGVEHDDERDEQSTCDGPE